jgi:hypothetical protein
MARFTFVSCDPLDLAADLASANETPVLTHYIIVRGDAPPGVQLAQAIHAAGESSSGNIPSGTFAVALAARDEEDLLSLEAELRAAGCPHVPIREPDAPWLNALMAIGIPPCQRELVRPYLRRFSLALRERPQTPEVSHAHSG